jgi:hypothetical protein
VSCLEPSLIPNHARLKISLSLVAMIVSLGINAWIFPTGVEKTKFCFIRTSLCELFGIILEPTNHKNAAVSATNIVSGSDSIFIFSAISCCGNNSVTVAVGIIFSLIHQLTSSQVICIIVVQTTNSFSDHTHVLLSGIISSQTTGSSTINGTLIVSSMISFGVECTIVVSPNTSQVSFA